MQAVGDYSASYSASTRAAAMICLLKPHFHHREVHWAKAGSAVPQLDCGVQEL